MGHQRLGKLPAHRLLPEIVGYLVEGGTATASRALRPPSQKYGVEVELGLGLAMAPVRSQYWLSEPNALFPRHRPAVVIPDARAYTRPEIGAPLFGLREEASLALDSRNLPADMSGYAFTDDPSGMRSLEYGVPALRRYIARSIA